MKLKSLLFCAGLMGAAAAQAHYLWIEPDAGGARLYYGEADALLKEKSPGKLDNIKAPTALALDAKGNGREAALERGGEYFRIAAKPGAGALLAKEESLAVRDLSKHGLGLAKSNYYARYGRADGQGEPMVLDLQAQGGNAFVLRYRGQPLVGAKLQVIAPNTWVQEHKTDSQGRVEINTPWRGRYVLHVMHVDPTPGEFAGQKYDSLRNHFTYVFERSKGAHAGPAQPPKYGMD